MPAVSKVLTIKRVQSRTPKLRQQLHYTSNFSKKTWARYEKSIRPLRQKGKTCAPRRSKSNLYLEPRSPSGAGPSMIDYLSCGLLCCSQLADMAEPVKHHSTSLGRPRPVSNEGSLNPWPSFTMLPIEQPPPNR